MCYEPDDNQLVDAMLLEQQIQVGVGKAAGTPMFLRHNLTRQRGEFGTDLAAPCAVFESLSRPRKLLDRRNVLPVLVVARAVTMMQRIEDAKLRLPRSIQDLQHMRNATIRFCNGPNSVPYLPTFRHESGVGVDDEKGGDVFVET